MRFVAAFAVAVVLTACASNDPVVPPGMPLPAGLHVTSVRHPALSVGTVTGDAPGKPAAVATSYAKDLQRNGWQVELHPGRLVARRGPWELDARLRARASNTVFAVEERHEHFYVAPRPRVKVNPQFFASRVGDARGTEQLAWHYERAKKLRESASALESAIAIAADEELRARQFARRYAHDSQPIVLDSRTRLGYVLAKEKNRAQSIVEWQKLLHDESFNAPPPHDVKGSQGRAWNGLTRALDARAIGTAPTHDELAFVQVLVAAEKLQTPQPPMMRVPVHLVNGQPQPPQLQQQQQQPQKAAAPGKRKPKRHKPWWRFWK